MTLFGTTESTSHTLPGESPRVTVNVIGAVVVRLDLSHGIWMVCYGDPLASHRSEVFLIEFFGPLKRMTATATANAIICGDVVEKNR